MSILLGVLTLKKHSNGVWITNLVDELRNLTKNINCCYKIEIVELDSLEINLCEKPNWTLLINRVSDAADPFDSKACLSVLHTCKIWNIPCFNGPESYAIGSNKYLHHIVFTRSVLLSPRSTLVRNINRDNLIISAKRLEEDIGCNWPFLIKPNSAGFGAGIQIFSKFEDFKDFCDSLLATAHDELIKNISKDKVLLIQEYIKPFNNEVYRVWFLDGLVQCGLKSVIDRTNEITFTNQCVGSVCTLTKSKNKHKSMNRSSSWRVPLDVAREIKTLLTHVGEDCHVGSVEFLYDSQGNRIYFDLNMLSTLPSIELVDNIDKIWPDDYNPWTELAQSVLNKIPPNNLPF